MTTFHFHDLFALISLASGKLNVFCLRNNLKDSKNVLIATCATWDSNCYLFKYHAIPKLWPGKNILCFSLRKAYCAGGCNEKKYLAVIHGRDRYHYIWNMKRFKYTLRQCDPNGEYQWVINTGWIANSGILKEYSLNLL